jgi:hypothetical protein
VSFAPAAALTYFADSPSFLYFLRAFALYILSLGISIGAYRLSPFHPLAKYPGPTLAKVSRFWAARQFLKGQQHRLSHELFLKYGDVVRTGPNHLIIRDAKAINTVLGPKDMWPKPGRTCTCYMSLQKHTHLSQDTRCSDPRAPLAPFSPPATRSSTASAAAVGSCLHSRRA